MATQLSRNFTLEEMPCYRSATPLDIARLYDTVQNVLQPVRDRWGLTRVTSWKWWRSGCVQRDGSHAGGGTVDFIVPGANLRDVFDWGVKELMPRGYIGRWIFEPEWRDDSGQLVQGEHIHVAPVRDMWEQTQRADSAAFVEGPPNTYTPVPGWGGHSGTLDDPIPVEGLVVVLEDGKEPPPWLLLLGGAVVVGVILKHSNRNR